MKGYYHSPGETAAAVNSEGWFNSRDLARAEHGNFFIVGRTKEMIVRYGFNVYPAEVEAVLNTHTAVVRSAVLGRTLPGDGNEEIIAFIQPSAGSHVTPEQLAEHAEKYLAPYKRPSQILIIDPMPLTPTGKAAKDELKKRIASPGK
jgi:acyl-CoA synthetase (AMP-forming)/AMP-acid ligase II